MFPRHRNFRVLITFRMRHLRIHGPDFASASVAPLRRSNYGAAQQSKMRTRATDSKSLSLEKTKVCMVRMEDWVLVHQTAQTARMAQHGHRSTLEECGRRRRRRIQSGNKAPTPGRIDRVTNGKGSRGARVLCETRNGVRVCKGISPAYDNPI